MHACRTSPSGLYARLLRTVLLEGRLVTQKKKGCMLGYCKGRESLSFIHAVIPKLHSSGTRFALVCLTDNSNGWVESDRQPEGK